jgi:hypothetical protein
MLFLCRQHDCQCNLQSNQKYFEFYYSLHYFFVCLSYFKCNFECMSCSCPVLPIRRNLDVPGGRLIHYYLIIRVLFFCHTIPNHSRSTWEACLNTHKAKLVHQLCAFFHTNTNLHFFLASQDTTQVLQSAALSHLHFCVISARCVPYTMHNWHFGTFSHGVDTLLLKLFACWYSGTVIC